MRILHSSYYSAYSLHGRLAKSGPFWPYIEWTKTKTTLKAKIFANRLSIDYQYTSYMHPTSLVADVSWLSGGGLSLGCVEGVSSAVTDATNGAPDSHSFVSFASVLASYGIVTVE